MSRQVGVGAGRRARNGQKTTEGAIVRTDHGQVGTRAGTRPAARFNAATAGNALPSSRAHVFTCSLPHVSTRSRSQISTCPRAHFSAYPPAHASTRPCPHSRVFSLFAFSLPTFSLSAFSLLAFSLSHFRTFSHFLTFPLFCLLLLSGCSSPPQARTAFEPVQIPNATAVPRAIIYGSLLDLLPHFDVTPALQMFLYGPSDYGKTALRNPQGMALMENILMVCDQGLPDLVAIDLATGRRLPFTDPNHRPRCPVAVATDAACVYVADTTMRCVLVYDRRGRLLEELAPTADPNRTFRPVSVLVHENILYAGNIADRRVERFDLNARQWLSPLLPPADMKKLVAPAGLDMLEDGTLLIVDAVQGHVLRCTRDGQWLPPIGRPGRRDGEFVRPKQVAHTLSGLILVADAGRQSVLVFDARGRHLMELHETNGDQPTQTPGARMGWRGFTLPMGVLPLPSASAKVMLPRLGHEIQAADEYVLVSDELGVPSLTLVGLVTRQTGEVTDAR